MANNVYGLYPWQWNAPGASNPVGHHSAPDGASCVLDFRPLGEQAKALQSGGYGFFAWPVGGISPPNDLISLGTGDVRSIVASNAAKTELKTKLGLGNNPAWTGATLADCIADVLGDFSVPDGSSGPKPLMPQDDGLLVIELGGHSPVWSRSVNKAELLSANPGKRHSRIRDVIRMSIDEAHKIGGEVLAGKVLGGILKQHGYKLTEIDAADKGNTSKKTEWERLLSVDKRGSVKPKKPETSFTENFDRVASSILGAQLTWEKLGPSGASEPGTWNSRNNHARYLSANAFARCTSAVSSSNNYAQAAMVASDDGAAEHTGGAICRMASGAVITGYYAAGYRSYSPDKLIVGKFVSGVPTGLHSYDANISMPTTIRVSANGSSLSYSSVGVERGSVTDTSISTGFLGGMYGYRGGGAEESEMDDWELTDLAAAPVAAFTGDPLTGTAPLSVVFTNTSTDDTSWEWSKSSDGVTYEPFAGTPTAENPTESFAAGTWHVKLVATGAGGSDEEIKAAYVVVTAASGHQNRLLTGVG